MLHEILLSLSGHPSPLLGNDYAGTGGQNVLSAPERDLLKTARHLSELHRNLIHATSKISTSDLSVISRAVSAAISSIHLAGFQRKILEVEAGILRRDAGLVGAYNIVPLTAVIGEFSGWTRRLEWLWELAQFMLRKNDAEVSCSGAALIDKLRTDLQTGYADIEETSLSLIRIAETAWLKQVSAWILYGRLPTVGYDDFFIQADEEDEQGYIIRPELLPSFVTSTIASSMLFIGASLNRVRARSTTESAIGELGRLSSQLQELSSLTYPLSSSSLFKAVTSIRMTLSRTILLKLLPLEKVVEMLQLLRQFFLLGRGEFAMALTQQADEKIRNRWRRADNLAHEKRDGLNPVTVKDGEVSAVLGRTWAAIGLMQGQHMDEDDEMELARGLLELTLYKAKNATTPSKSKTQATSDRLGSVLVTTPFRNLLLSVPVVMNIRIPSPLDLFLTAADAQTYTIMNSYLLSIRRAHLHLTDLWKITSLRRHHRAPPRPPYSNTESGKAKTRTLRQRWSERSAFMRSTWTTSSAAIFFLAETEAYFQIDIVETLWVDFHTWLIRGNAMSKYNSSRPGSTHQGQNSTSETTRNSNPTLDSGPTISKPSSGIGDVGANRDPQTLATAHRLYMSVVARRLLLTQHDFTEPLYDLLIHIDHLVAMIRRLDGIWTSIDLEMDEGVVDAFTNLESEEADVKLNIRTIEGKVKRGVEEVVGALRKLSLDGGFLAEMESDGPGNEGEEILHIEDEDRYTPRRVGGVDRLLMKLDFGGWFDTGKGSYHVDEYEF
ncbi:Spc97/Spc98 family protein [Xylariales sp. PMI_506]|nr:Spc97/Spc98 family protein [Xylariales sp. PMI_506]